MIAGAQSLFVVPARRSIGYHMVRFGQEVPWAWQSEAFILLGVVGSDVLFVGCGCLNHIAGSSSKFTLFW